MSRFLPYLAPGIAILAYYRLFIRIVGGLSGPVVRSLGLDRRYPMRHVDGMVKLALAGISQAAFAVSLMLVTHVAPSQLVLTGIHASLLVYGVFLGIGEMVFISFLCSVAMRAAMRVAPGGPTRLEDWLTVACGGWLYEYLRTLEIAPLPIALVLILIYVSGEEVVFRGLLISDFHSAGLVWAVGVSTLLFMLVQTFQIPAWRSGLFPVIGAATVGIVHGLLFVAVPTVVPLIVAHLTFFLSATLGANSRVGFERRLS